LRRHAPHLPGPRASGDRVSKRLRRSLAAFSCLSMLLLLAAPSALGGAATASYRCSSLLSVTYLRTVTGLHAVPAAGNSAKSGPSVTCTFSFLPALPPGFRFGPFKFTMSTRRSDLNSVKTRFGSQLRSYPGLGSQSVETVSPLGVITFAAIGHGFTLLLTSGDRRVNPTMMASIARKLYAQGSP
jgi:hypothetical protein